MASVRKTTAGNFELTVRSKLLPGGRVFLTFEDEGKAEKYGAQCDRLLKSGIVPPGLVKDKASDSGTSTKLANILRDWMASGNAAPTELDLLGRLTLELGRKELKDLTYTWAQEWVAKLKIEDNLAPGTIRKRIGALSRCLDDFLRSNPDINIGNPLRLLPRGATSYNQKDRADVVKAGGKVKQDVRRERRLLPGEYDRIMLALAGEKRPDRERALDLKEGDALRLLFQLILATGVRLREAYTLKISQIKMRERVIVVRSSKQWYGREKLREVPMQPELHSALAQYLKRHEKQGEDLLFPWWDGNPDNLNKVTSRLSGQFRRLFEYAQCENLTEHDLRHEATCRWYQMRSQDGGWLYREIELERIMGWEPGSSMPSRYASFRAEDLAQRMYQD